VNYLVLGAGFIFEGLSFRVGLKEMRSRFPRASFWSAIRASKDPSVFTALLEDAAALVGLVIALAGLVAAHATGDDRFDGVASLLIGLLLILTAAVLAREVLSLMTGESASRDVREKVGAVLAGDPRVKAAPEILTMHLGPQSILVAVSIDFDDAMKSAEIEQAARDLSAAVRAAHPALSHVYLKPIDEPAPAG
jgi:divalent metal cation (Fe/Co/Zn/Cd) transporter